ncbi:MAG TPA: response regulator [Anaerolineaceae bacterium]|nr:response regulator [Anaerolineaceae bacterium]
MSVPFGPILVVEDTPNVRELLVVTLRFKGYPVVAAHDGQEALEMIARERPSLVITDIMMPKVDGYSLVHQMRKDPHTASIPVLFISATYTTHEDKKFALNLGAIKFIEKPIDTEDFLLTVAEILTQGSEGIPAPMADGEFYQGYRTRLESKLRYKRTQAARIERLLETLPEEQQPAFQAMLAEAQDDAGDIQAELDELAAVMAQLNGHHPGE